MSYDDAAENVVNEPFFFKFDIGGGFAYDFFRTITWMQVLMILAVSCRKYSGNGTNANSSLNERKDPYADSITHAENEFIMLSMNCTIASHR